MNRLVLSFIILVAILFIGIFIMIKPTFFVPPLFGDKTVIADDFMQGGPMPRIIIIIGSTLTMSGVVGLSILGFIIFKDTKAEETSGPSSIS